MSGSDVSHHKPGTPYGTRFVDLDLSQLMAFKGHGALLRMNFHALGERWIELALPWSEALTVDATTGALASGPILSLLDNATGIAVWQRAGEIVPQVTVDLRLDHLRPSTKGRTLIGRGECLTLTGSIAFVRGIAYEEDPDDPVALVTGTYMAAEGYRP